MSYVKVKGYPGVAFRTVPYERDPEFIDVWWDEENEEWVEEEINDPHFGTVGVMMVGDNRVIHVDPYDVEAIQPDSFCRSCGQIGCQWDVYDE